MQILCFSNIFLNFLLSQIHYMYFAAFSFWVTGAVAAAVSLLTPRDEEFRVKKTQKNSFKIRQKTYISNCKSRVTLCTLFLFLHLASFSQKRNLQKKHDFPSFSLYTPVTYVQQRVSAPNFRAE